MKKAKIPEVEILYPLVPLSMEQKNRKKKRNLKIPICQKILKGLSH